MKVSSLYIAQMKAECRLEMQANRSVIRSNRSGDKKQPKSPPEKREAMSSSVTDETTTSETPAETKIDKAFMLPSVLVSAGAFCLRSRLDVGDSE